MEIEKLVNPFETDDERELRSRLAAAEAELSALQASRARRVAAARRALGRLLRVAPLAAFLAFAAWVLGQGIEVRTTDTAADKLRMSIETSVGGADADAAFMDAELGVGTQTPTCRLHVLRTVDPATILIDGIGSVTPAIIGRRANGTPGALSALTSGDSILILIGQGYGSTAYSSSRAILDFRSSQAWTDAAQGTNLQFRTTGNGTTSTLERMRIQQDGSVGINTMSPDALLDVEQLNAGALGPVVRLTGGGAAGAQCAIDMATFDAANNVPAARILGTDDGNYGVHIDLQTRDASSALQSRLRVATSGNVGIGTTNPQTRLHVAGGGNGDPSNTGAFFEEDGNGHPRIELRGTAKTPYIDFLNDTASDYDCRLILTGDDELHWQNSRLRIDSGNWTGLYIDVNGGRSVSLENNTGLGGGGGLRIYDQSGAGLIADFATDNTWTIQQGGTIKWSGGTGTNTLDFNKGASKIFDDAQFRIRTDDFVYIQKTGGGNLTGEITFEAADTRPTNDVIVGRYVSSGGVSPLFCLHANRTSATVCIFDRTGSDGWIVALQQDGVNEGSISVSGTTVSYNTFTGSHYAWTPGGRTYERWTLVAATGENETVWGDETETAEVVFGIATTSLPEDPRVLGAYLARDEEHPEGWHYVAAVGDGFLLVTDSNGDIGLGDFITSSVRAGYGQRQSADRIMNYTVAKSMQSVDWSQVPVDPAKGFKWKLIAVTYRAG